MPYTNVADGLAQEMLNVFAMNGMFATPIKIPILPTTMDPPNSPPQQYATMLMEYRDRNAKFGVQGQGQRMRFDRTKYMYSGVLYIENGIDRDVQLTFGSEGQAGADRLQLREYQLFAICGFTQAILDASPFKTRRQLNDSLLTTMRIFRFPNLPEVWNVRMSPVSTYDMSTLDSSFEWTSVEGWYTSKEYAN